MSVDAFAEDKRKNYFYLGGKLLVGSAHVSVGNYTNIPAGTIKDGKKGGKATQVRWGGGAVLGGKFSLIPLLALRTELEYLHGRAAKTFAQGGETKLGLYTDNLLINTYLDFDSLHSLIKPYVSIGLGMSINELKYTPASIDINSGIANPINFICQAGLGTYILLGNVALDLNIRYLYNGTLQKTYVNSAGNAYRVFKASPHMVEGLVSLLVFL